MNKEKNRCSFLCEESFFILCKFYGGDLYTIFAYRLHRLNILVKNSVFKILISAKIALRTGVKY